MNSSIFVPKTINVGYQNRSGTYTGKLAYVIYYDEKGKLRKEASWNSWRDDKILNDEFDNVPTEEREVEVRYGQKEIQTHMIPVSIETVFEKLKPVCKQKYLANGREYEKEYEFNE